MIRMDIQRNQRITLAEIERIFYYPNQDHLNLNKFHTNNTNNDYNDSLNSSLRQSKGNFSTSVNLSHFMSNSINSNTSMQSPSSLAKETNDNLLASLFNLLVQTESTIEQMKTELALRKDFNAEDAFAVFESNSSGLIYFADLRYGLSCFGLNPTKGEVHLLLQKYSLLSNNQLNYADFFDMLVPFDKDARMLIEKRLASPFVSKYDKTNCFLGGTKDIIAKLFEYIIISENKLEVIRTQINKKYTINLHLFCEGIDINRKSYITNEDLWNYLCKIDRSRNVTQKKSDLLFIRLDRNRDGRVEYDDIRHECDQKSVTNIDEID